MFYYVTRSGKHVKLYYEEYGAGLPVLLMHAYPFRGDMWNQQVEALKSFCRVIVPDLRGFGQSDATNDLAYTMEEHAQDMLALLDHLGIEQVVLGGMSMGGYISLAFLRAYPSRLKGLMLIDTRSTPDTDEQKRNRESLAQHIDAHGTQIVASKMLPDVLVSPSDSEAYQTAEAMITRNERVGVAHVQRAMALRTDTTHLLPDIAVPTLVVVGEHDTLTTPEDMHKMHEAIPGSQYVVIPKAGHVSNVDNPEAFNAALLEFLKGIA